MDPAANTLISKVVRQASLLAVLTCTATVTDASGAPANSAEMPPAQLYEVTTETVMPHLEENLRYTTTHERRCLRHLDLTAAFPILGHPALKGCALTHATGGAAALSYLLVCTGGHGTTGRAIWHIDAGRIRGTLNVKLGGKNMTFSQRVTALPQGICKADDST
jgi:hypothetical protein